jgi:hypothetical protein
MKIVLRITPAALAIAGFVTVQTPSQAMPVQTALVEFGRDKDGALRRHGTTRLQNHLATLQLRPNSVCKGRHVAGCVPCECATQTRPSSLHALCFVETAVAFLHHDEQTTACCSLSHVAQPAYSVAL